ncbi:MAG: nuclear transport factor 2 family protein [Planctomycetota bacterium]|nr:nuclear transport factor 2 family protein [Planctomycetota bacterium]MCX8040500.1 nuclear transport factor 2 family protein [Planctomycetota bacterium]MDW8373506.1 nuclear transport factor 2 family protein [Planctomycetota bacterium]
MTEPQRPSPQAALAEYLDAYMRDRDLAATLALWVEEPTCIGTGFDEIGFVKQRFDELYTRDIAEAPARLDYEIVQQVVQQPRPDVAIIALVLHMRTVIANQELRFNGMRLSLVFVGDGPRWRIAHMHLSLPTTAHGADESFPVRELEERNRVLQRLVDERTAQLVRVNEQLRAINHELQQRVAEIRVLTGLLPICSGCKKIRDDGGQWQPLESYISARSEARFSHGLCPACAQRLYPELYSQPRP